MAANQVSSFISATFANAGKPKSKTEPNGQPKAPTYAEQRAEKRFFETVNESAYAGLFGGIQLDNQALANAQAKLKDAPSSKSISYKTGINSKQQVVGLESERNAFISQVPALKAQGLITDEQSADILAQYAVGINKAKESVRDVAKKTAAFFKNTVKSNVEAVKVSPPDSSGYYSALGYQ